MAHGMERRSTWVFLEKMSLEEVYTSPRPSKIAKGTSIPQRMLVLDVTVESPPIMKAGNIAHTAQIPARHNTLVQSNRGTLKAYST